LKSQLAATSFNVVIAHQSLVSDISILPRDRFVLFISEPKKETLLTALNHGVRGYFSENPPEELLKVTVSLLPEQCQFDPALFPWVIKLINDEVLPSLNRAKEMLLTTREQDIYALRQSGLSYAEMANTLSIAKSTVKRHMANIASKLR